MNVLASSSRITRRNGDGFEVRLIATIVHPVSGAIIASRHPLPISRRRSIIALLLAATASSWALPAQNETYSGRVIGISDGDTIRVLHNGVSERVRLWGIDCPESKQPFGTRAKQFTADLAFDKTVSVIIRDKDRYGRTVAEIVKAGFAWWYVQFAKHDTELRNFEAEARETRRGLWVDSNPIPPWQWRKR
jgi:micrococcal nuclease